MHIWAQGSTIADLKIWATLTLPIAFFPPMALLGQLRHWVIIHCQILKKSTKTSTVPTSSIFHPCPSSIALSLIVAIRWRTFKLQITFNQYEYVLSKTVFKSYALRSFFSEPSHNLSACIVEQIPELWLKYWVEPESKYQTSGSREILSWFSFLKKF